MGTTIWVGVGRMSPLFFPKVTLWDRKSLVPIPGYAYTALLEQNLFLLSVWWLLMLEDVRNFGPWGIQSLGEVGQYCYFPHIYRGRTETQ